MGLFRLRIAGIFLTITGILVACNIYTLIPLYSAIGEEMSIPANKVSLGSMFFTLFYAFGLLIFGPISDRFGRKRIIIGGLFFSALTTILVSMATTPMELFFYRGLQGFTLASFAPVTFLYVFELFNGKERTMWLALINTGFLTAGILGQLAASFLLNIGTWTWVFIAFACLYGSFHLLNFLILPKTATFTRIIRPKEIIKDMGTVITNREMAALYLIVFSILFSFVAFYEAWGYLGGENMMLFRGIGLGGAPLSIFTGTFIEKFGAQKTLFVGIVLGWGSIFTTLFLQSQLFIGVVSMFFVASIALLIPTIIHLIGVKSGKFRGKALSLYSFILLIGASFGSFVASLFSYTIVLIILLAFFTLDFLLSLRIGGESKMFETKQSLSRF